MTPEADGVPLGEFDREVLRSLNGEDVPGLAWGAAMSVAIEYLHGKGLVTRRMKTSGLTYEISDKGRAALAAAEAK